MTPVVPFDEAQKWLAQTRAAVSKGWPTSVIGPRKHQTTVAHKVGRGAVLVGDPSHLEVAPGVVAAVEDLEFVYLERDDD